MARGIFLRMDKNRDGTITLGAFTRTVLPAGRISSEPGMSGPVAIGTDWFGISVRRTWPESRSTYPTGPITDRRSGQPWFKPSIYHTIMVNRLKLKLWKRCKEHGNSWPMQASESWLKISKLLKMGVAHDKIYPTVPKCHRFQKILLTVKNKI